MTVSRAALGLECALLFGVVPAALAWMRSEGRRVPILALLVLAALLAYSLLRRDPGYDRSELTRTDVGRTAWLGVLARAAVASVLLAVVVLALEPQRWLALPRTRPGLWVAVMLLYPLLSVIPQELVFRCFFFRRYRTLFTTPGRRVLASAVAFGWAHVLFLSGLSVALTLVGGWVLARSFERRRSFPLVSVEHALYGCVVFTLGLGRHFYAGA